MPDPAPLWTGVALLAYLTLPLIRSGRNFLPLDYTLHPVALGPGLHWLVAVAALAVFALYLRPAPAPRAARRRADYALGFIVIGGLGLAASLFSTQTPFGWGALGAFLGLAIAAGACLSEANRVGGDVFTGAGIVLALAFVTLFITYPLLAVLRSAFWLDGVLTLRQFAETFSSPLFLFVDNRYTELDEGRMVSFWAAGGAVAGLLCGL